MVLVSWNGEGEEGGENISNRGIPMNEVSKMCLSPIVMVNLMSTSMGYGMPRYLVKHYCKCTCEFLNELLFESLV